MKQYRYRRYHPSPRTPHRRATNPRRPPKMTEERDPELIIAPLVVEVAEAAAFDVVDALAAALAEEAGLDDAAAADPVTTAEVAAAVVAAAVPAG
jgi:hypothetical protein